MSKKSEPNDAEKMKGKKYMKELRKLQAELCHLQEWVKLKGLRVILGLALVALTKAFGG